MKEVKKNKKRYHYWLGIVVLLIVVYVIWVFQFSYPSLRPTYLDPSFSATTASAALPFPAYGQSAVGIDSYGVVSSSGKQSPAPIASTAKLITALCVLAKYPITNVTTSPTITLTQSDVDIYNSYLNAGGSVVKVAAGEKITEYQMLEAMLLPSANNMADSLAIWAFGSLANYSTYANNYLTSHNLSDTKVGTDASGFDPSTVSTANDLIKLGQIAINNPILSQIVALKSVTGIPVTGSIINVNSLLGMSNINGIKTGNTAQAGGVYISSSTVTQEHTSYLITTAVMGAPSLWRALNDSYKLIAAAQANFATPMAISKVHSGAVIGQYSVPWSKNKIDAVSAFISPVIVWGGNSIEVNITLHNISDKSKAGVSTGTINVYDNKFNNKWSSKILLLSSVPQPSRWWLLFHPTVSLRV